MGKLKNIKAVKQMITGDHRAQTRTTVSFSDTEKKEIKRKVGERWVDENGVEWEQKEGYRISIPKVITTVKRARNCEKENCTFGWHKLDKKYEAIHGLCFDCAIKKEHEMRINGTWKEYEKTRVVENIKAWLKDVKQDVEELKKSLQQEYTFVNEDGSQEKWQYTGNLEALKESIDKEYKKIEEHYLKIIEDIKNKE